MNMDMKNKKSTWVIAAVLIVGLVLVLRSCAWIAPSRPAKGMTTPKPLTARTTTTSTTWGQGA